MSKNKTKLQLAVAWTLAVVFALSTLLLAVKLFYKTEDKNDDTVNAIETFASATAPSLLKTGLNNNVSLMSTGEPSAQAISGDLLTLTAETVSMQLLKPSSAPATTLQQTFRFTQQLSGLYDDVITFTPTIPAFAAAAATGAATTVYGFDIYANDILIFTSERGTLGTFNTAVAAPSDNVVLSVSDLLSKGLQPSTQYQLTVQVIPMVVTSGWTGSPVLCDVQTANCGKLTISASVELPAAPTKTGYTFTGWYTDEACTQKYTADYVTSDITLYAGFTANTYSVKFNANGGTGSMSNQTHTYDKSLALTANAFSKTGYHFAGWATSANGNIVYSNSQSVSNLASEQGATVNLYAKWEANNYTIKFNANGGSGSMSDLAMTYDSAKNLTANAFTYNQYHFIGWATSADGDVVHTDKASVNNLTTTNNGTVTLYAKWAINYYTVTYKDGNTVLGTESIITDSYANLIVDAPEKEGKIFIGWTLPDGTLYTSQVLNSDTVLTAKYAVKQYVVTFVVDGQVHHQMIVEHGTSLSDLLDEAYPALLYDAGEVDENF